MDVVLWPKILANRLRILMSILILVSYFFKCKKSNFNLESSKCICQGNFVVYHVTGFNYSRILSQGYLQNFERNWKNSICIGFNNFFKPVILLSLHKEKKLKLSKFEYCSLCWKVNFSVIHPTHITIYSFWRKMFSWKVL